MIISSQSWRLLHLAGGGLNYFIGLRTLLILGLWALFLLLWLLWSLVSLQLKEVFHIDSFGGELNEVRARDRVKAMLMGLVVVLLGSSAAHGCNGLA